MKKSSGLCVLAGCIITACSAQAAGDVPRYKLEIGQELVYESSSDFHYQGGSFKGKGTTTFWVTGQNPDGSWHILLLKKSSTQQTRKDEAFDVDERRKFNTFDLFADGRVAVKHVEVEGESLAYPFFQLPGDAAHEQSGWEVSENDASQLACRLKTTPASPAGQWVFETTQKGIFHDIYQMTETQTISFDGARGLIEKVDSENAQGYGFVGKGTGKVELKSAAIKDREWITQLAREGGLCDTAKEAERAAVESLKAGTNAAAAKATAAAELKSALSRVKLPVVKEEIQSELNKLDQSFKYAAEEEGESDNVLNKPAATWETTDLDGHKHALEDYRGKVVALDFWYRGCGWCMRAMPQIKALADQFHGQPVVILGMNTDREDKDARFVVDKLQLNYTTLKAEKLPAKYGVQGFPTFIVIDQQGIVRARHVGYSTTLQDDMARTIADLLKQGPEEKQKGSESAKK